jgi:hypothetical protein
MRKFPDDTAMQIPQWSMNVYSLLTIVHGMIINTAISCHSFRPEAFDVARSLSGRRKIIRLSERIVHLPIQLCAVLIMNLALIPIPSDAQAMVRKRVSAKQSPLSFSKRTSISSCHRFRQGVFDVVPRSLRSGKLILSKSVVLILIQSCVQVLVQPGVSAR